jgi:peptide/nickel transport system permease protein
MRGYVLTRIGASCVTLLVVTFIAFGAINLVPGSIVDVLAGDQGYTQEQARELEHQLGMDRPLPQRYASWLGNVFEGDLGHSLKSGRNVTDIVQHTLPVTLELAIFSTLITIVIGIPLGIITAIRQDKAEDHLLRGASIAFISVPSFWLGTMIIVLPSIWWHWTPPLIFKDFAEDPYANLKMLLIPALILGVNSAALVIRVTRSAMLEVLREDYVRTARAKGLPEILVIQRHAVKNALLPVITVLGGQFAFLMGGTVVVEVIFGIPGMGQAMVNAIAGRDFQVITGLTLVIGAIVVFVNLLVDLMYRVLDPRITL